ncbi:hypothetical protein ACNKHK_03930 [Shigella flexneri]
MPNPGAAEDFLSVINPESLVIKQGYAEPSLQAAVAGKAFQFEREGYFCLDSRYATAENRYLTVPLVCVIRGLKWASNLTSLNAALGVFFASQKTDRQFHTLHCLMRTHIILHVCNN